jgi:hypothetical protein
MRAGSVSTSRYLLPYRLISHEGSSSQTRHHDGGRMAIVKHRQNSSGLGLAVFADHVMRYNLPRVSQ